MIVESFLITDKKRQIQGPVLKAENACACGCSPLTFILISDGKSGLNAKFESLKELDEFKKQVNKLNIIPTK